MTQDASQPTVIPVPLVEPPERLLAAANDIAKRGWALVPDFLPTCAVEGLRREVAARREAGHFRPAAIGRASSLKLTPEVRSDVLSWIEPNDPAVAVNTYLLAMEDLRRALNRQLYLGLLILESQFAIYPPGSFYRRHLDRHRDSDERVLSCVLYLNHQWCGEDGGQLRLYCPEPDGSERPYDIVPDAGRLIAFLSDRVPHEVLSTRRERLSIASWFRGRPRR